MDVDQMEASGTEVVKHLIPSAPTCAPSSHLLDNTAAWRLRNGKSGAVIIPPQYSRDLSRKPPESRDRDKRTYELSLEGNS